MSELYQNSTEHKCYIMNFTNLFTFHKLINELSLMQLQGSPVSAVSISAVPGVVLLFGLKTSLNVGIP